MTDDIILNKVEIIERCLKRINEEYINHEKELETNYTKQDSIILNLQRACEATIDIANRIIRQKKQGIPQNSRESFILLEETGIITNDISKRMQTMVGFRNIAVHDYTKLNLEIIHSIIKSNLNDFTEFNKQVIKKSSN